MAATFGNLSCDAMPCSLRYLQKTGNRFSHGYTSSIILHTHSTAGWSPFRTLALHGCCSSCPPLGLDHSFGSKSHGQGLVHVLIQPSLGDTLADHDGRRRGNCLAPIQYWHEVEHTRMTWGGPSVQRGLRFRRHGRMKKKKREEKTSEKVTTADAEANASRR